MTKDTLSRELANKFFDLIYHTYTEDTFLAKLKIIQETDTNKVMPNIFEDECNVLIERERQQFTNNLLNFLNRRISLAEINKIQSEQFLKYHA